MELLLVSAAWLIFLLYCLSSIGKNYFGREVMTSPRNSKIPLAPLVTCIVPARNEEVNIERCVLSLLEQSYPPDRYEIIVVDDNSTDDTASIVRAIRDPHSQLSLYHAAELPDGWTGKNHACWTGFRQARGDWLCFVDADVVAQPRLLETAIHFASSRKLGLLSINPFQELVSVSERCLLPGIFFAISSSMNFKNANDPSKSEAIANGQFMLFKRRAYESIDGHQAIQDEIMEDMALARAAKQSGIRICWLFGEDLVRTRMYRSISDIWEGFSKNLIDVMRIKDPAVSLYICVKSLLLGWMPFILPLLIYANLDRDGKDIIGYWGCGLSISASVSMLIAALFTVRFLRIPFWYFLFFPLGLTMHSVLTVSSFWKSKSGGRKWKGRIY